MHSLKYRKENLRTAYKDMRDTLSPSYKKSSSEKIARSFFKLLKKLRRAGTVGIYMKKGSEVNTIPILKKLLSLKKTVAAPRADKRNRSLKFFKVRYGLKSCRPGSYNIMEPKPRCPEVPSDRMDILIVPGIVFDAQGYRLGYGKGFYDKFLKKYSKLTVGLTYEKTFTKNLPHGTNDFPVQCIITEKRIIRCRS